MWLGSGDTTVEYVIQTPGGGAPTIIGVPSTGGGVVNISNLVTNGTRMGIAFSTNFPYGALSTIDIASQTLGSFTAFGGQRGTSGAVQVGNDSYAFGGQSSGGAPISWHWPIASPSAVIDINVYTGAETLGCPCEDGTSFWSPLCGTTTMYQVPIATFGANTFTPYTLAAASLAFGLSVVIAPQTGFDGRFMYLAADAGGVIIFDTTTQTSVVVNTGTNFANCYYSTNLGMVILDDTAGNIYTMPPGATGGSLINIGNSNTITGDLSGSPSSGFGDGPGGTLWGSANNNTATVGYMYSYLAAPPNNIIMVI